VCRGLGGSLRWHPFGSSYSSEADHCLPLRAASWAMLSFAKKAIRSALLILEVAGYRKEIDRYEPKECSGRGPVPDRCAHQAGTSPPLILLVDSLLL